MRRQSGKKEDEREDSVEIDEETTERRKKLRVIGFC